MYTPVGTEIKVIGKKVQDQIILEVCDKGLGIPEGSVEKIFDKFYRVPGSPTGGTGLGLSIVKSIIELHKAVISFENLKPQGACFRIKFRLETQPQSPVEPL